ncbi:MAG: monovalent cation:proton antiporter-2 (CPA2) family protein [Limnobacter sp.]|nr:monovalent cation:proton antiporter-2 (CPA2) family protein [Limnobacter sp.]
MLSAVYFLLAAAIAVPLFKRFGLGSILGYLAAGVVMGPSILGLIDDPEKVLHFSEIGVILLLFVIGLELEPAKLWNMRNRVVGLGAGQMGLTAVILYFVLHSVFGMESNSALVISMALALSSTAFAIQLMADKGILGNQDGRNGFSILLFQDLAVVPVLFIAQAVSPMGGSEESGAWWLAPLAVLALVGFARYIINPALSFMSRYGGREIMTVVALLIVLGSAELMHIVGLSAGMGAFMAGMMLANSSFRHQLEADVEPFKGLSLGLFFISIGMTLNLGLILESPAVILFGTVGLMALKTLLIAGICRLAGASFSHGIPLGLMLSQGGEFAFVIMAQSTASGLIDTQSSGTVNLIVGLSMALTSPAVSAIEKLFERKAEEKARADDKDFEHEHPEVIIMGFGRFGQVTGRILAANHIPFTALDKDADHIEFVKKFGNKVYYGDAERSELLEAAGLKHARTVVVAIDDPRAVMNIVKFIHNHYPKVEVIARAHNRVDYLSLKSAGAKVVIREVFASGLAAAEATLRALGFSDSQAIEVTRLFEQHDIELLDRARGVENDPDKLVEIGLEARDDLEEIFRSDLETK